MRGRGALKERGRKEGRQPSRKTPKPWSIPGGKPNRSVHAQQAPSRPQLVGESCPRHRGAEGGQRPESPASSGEGSKGRVATESSAPRDPPSAPAAAGERAPGFREAVSPGPRVQPGAPDAAPDTRRRTLRHPLGHPGHPEETRPR